MPEIPTHNELYSQAEDEIHSTSGGELRDFSAGSLLDAFAGVIAAIARGVLRYVSQTFLEAFISTAPDGDLERTATDKFGTEVARNPGESTAEYRERVEAYRDDGLKRGTPPALRYYARQIDGVGAVSTEENKSTNTTTVDVLYDPEETDESSVREAFFDGVEEWRPAGGVVNLNLRKAIEDTSVETPDTVSTL